MRYIDDIFSATSDASMIFEGSGGFMFGDSAQGTGIFPTAVKKADGSIIEKPLELEGEGGSSVNYLDVTQSAYAGTVFDGPFTIRRSSSSLMAKPYRNPPTSLGTIRS